MVPSGIKIGKEQSNIIVERKNSSK